jgi:hypothetical protein
MQQGTLRLRRRGIGIGVSIAEALESRRLLSGTPHLDPHLLKDLRKGEEEDIEPVHVLPGTPDPYAPPLGGTIEAVNFDTQASATGFYTIPPDNSAAAGPSHVVNVVNSVIQWFTKAGVQQRLQSLGSFFTSLSPLTGGFDPRVLYDQYNNRFVVVCLEKTDIADGAPNNTSRIFVAVSDDSDPNGTWFFAQINSKLNIAGADRWADFPGLGIDSQAIYITANEFGFSGTGGFGGSRLWIVNKTGLYTGGAASVNVYDPSTLAALPGGSQNSSMQAAQMFGAAPGSTGTFLVASGWGSGGSELLSVIRIDNPLSSPTFTNQFVNFGDIDSGAGLSSAPQSGTATGVLVGDRRVSNAVWRNNALWTCSTITPNVGADAGTPTAHWYKINTTNLASLTVADQGNVGAEDVAAGTRTFFPWIMVDAAGDMGLGFSASAPSIFPGAYYTGRLAADPAGTVQATSTLAAGVAFYIRTFGGPNRWGDYSSVSLDPSDNATFWVYNQYASTQGTNIGGEVGRYATRYGKFVFSTSAPPAPSTPDLTAASDAGPSNTDNITRITTPTFTGTAEANSTVKIFANGSQVGSGTATGGVYTISTSFLIDGPYSITATATNAIGTSPSSGALSVTIDTVAPSLVSTPTFNYLVAPHSVTYSFSDNVAPSLTESDVTVQNTTTTTTVPAAQLHFAYNGSTNVATLTFPGVNNFGVAGVLPDGNYTNTIAAANVTDVAGNALTATNIFGYYFLAADGNHDKAVDTLDFNALAANFGGTGRNFSQANFNYDASGTVDTLDFNLLASKFGASLPPESSEAGALAAAAMPGAPPIAGEKLFSETRLVDEIEL